jgi:hypothetical protein
MMMPYEEFIQRVEVAVRRFKEAQENEGVESKSRVQEDELLGELIGHMEDEVVHKLNDEHRHFVP